MSIFHEIIIQFSQDAISTDKNIQKSLTVTPKFAGDLSRPVIGKLTFLKVCSVTFYNDKTVAILYIYYKITYNIYNIQIILYIIPIANTYRLFRNIGTIHKHIIHNLSSKTRGDITHSKKIIRKLAVKMYYVLICFFIIAKVEKLSKQKLLLRLKLTFSPSEIIRKLEILDEKFRDQT